MEITDFYKGECIMENAWRNFKEGVWCDEINVSNFIKMNYTAYDGDTSFLEGPTKRTKKEMAAEKCKW